METVAVLFFNLLGDEVCSLALVVVGVESSQFRLQEFTLYAAFLPRLGEFVIRYKRPVTGPLDVCFGSRHRRLAGARFPGTRGTFNLRQARQMTHSSPPRARVCTVHSPDQSDKLHPTRN